MSTSRAARQASAPLAPRGLSREEAATYVGVSPNKFDTLVEDGRMPKPKLIDGRRIWDRLKLDSSFAALPDADGRRDGDDRWGRFAV